MVKERGEREGGTRLGVWLRASQLMRCMTWMALDARGQYEEWEAPARDSAAWAYAHGKHGGQPPLLVPCGGPSGLFSVRVSYVAAQHSTSHVSFVPIQSPILLFPLLYFNGTYNTKLLYLVSFGSGSANQSVRYCLAAARTLTCTVGYEY